MTIERKKRFLIDAAFIAVVAVLVYLVLKFSLRYFLPFVIGLVIAVIVQKPARYISHAFRIKKGIVSVILVVVMYLFTLSLITLLCVLIYNLASSFIGNISSYMDNAKELLGDINARFSEILDKLPPEVVSAVNKLPETILTKLSTVATNFLSSSVTTIATNLPTLLITVIVTVVASCYLAKDYDRVMGFVHKHTSEKVNRVIADTKEIFFKSILKIVKSYALLMLLTFTELTIGFLIIGVNNPIMLAAIIAVVDVLPVLGTGAILIPWGIFSLVNGNIWLAVGLLLLYLAITVIRNFIEPKIIGDQVGLYPLLTLVAMFVGLRFAGLLGMLGFPIIIIIISGLQKRGSINLFGDLSKKSE